MELWEKPAREGTAVRRRSTQALALIAELRLTAQPMHRKAYWQELEIHCQSQLARLDEREGRSDSARQQLLACLESCEEFELYHHKAVILLHLARYCRKHKEYRQALGYTQASHELVGSVNSYWPYCLSWEEEANIFADCQEYRAAVMAFHLALRFRSRNHLPQLQATEKEAEPYFQGIASAQKNGDWDAAGGAAIEKMSGTELEAEYRSIMRTRA
jgi:tetratricopeptide (TPR) repeat protein